VNAAWTRYEPSAGSPWNLRRVVLLHRRCGFAATWEELERDLADGPHASIDRLLQARSRTHVPTDFEEAQRQLAGGAIASSDIARLQAWWIFRMLHGPDPLAERLTLLWHDHFATSQAKVNDVGHMHAQNETLRRHACGPFRELLLAMLRDPALLIWLDAPANGKAKPNENLARELLELFTLGVGHYDEQDVKEAARTLTGWSVRRGRVFEAAADHDDGEKRVLGRTGALRTPDLAAILLDHPATSERLAWRLVTTFLGEEVASDAARAELAAELRTHDLDLCHAVDLVLRSELFFSERNLDARVASPVEFIVGLARALELDREHVSTLLLADWAARMGHELFLPPNVGGWKGGRSWLDTQGLVQRANFVTALARGELAPRSRDWTSWASERGGEAGLDASLELIARVLRGAPFVGTAPGAGGDPSARVGELLARPEFLLV
jgi:uncharacterized protein (DUF1800 family)